MPEVRFFAVLKDYFGTSIPLIEVSSISEIKKQLELLNPSSKDILNKSRFALNEEFVDLDTKIESNDLIYVLPPSSGG